MNTVLSSLRPWAEIASLFGIVTALVIAVANMYWQLRLQNARLRHDLFDRRLEVYRSVRDFVHSLMTKGSVERRDLDGLTKHAMAVEFLFRQEVVSFLNEAYQKAMNLCEWDIQRQKRGRELPEPDERCYQETRMWFSHSATAQLENLFSDDLMLYRK
jgi:hypothetical protein